MALASGAAAAQHALLVVAGGDMPSLRPEVLRAMLEAAVPGDDDDGAVAPEAVVLAERGVRRPLPAVLRRGAAIAATGDLTASGERSLMALIDALAASVIQERSWRAFDPEGLTLRDVDAPADLAHA